MGNIDLKNIERKAYISYHRDGLDDIFEAVALALMAPLFLGRGYVWVFALGIAVRSCHLGRDFLRRFFTLPRLGCQPSDFPGDRRRLLNATVAALPMLLLGALLFWMIDSKDSVGVGTTLGWKLPLYAVAVLTPLPLFRLVVNGDLFAYIHMALYLEGGFVGLFLILLGLKPGWATALLIWGLAVVLMAIGLVRWARFAHVHSRSARE